MGLLQNRFRHSLTGKMFGATAISGSNPSMLRGTFSKPSHKRNFLCSEAITNKQASMPAGKRHPYAWMMANEGGGISSYQRTNIAVNAVGTLELGFPRGGNVTVTVGGSGSIDLVAGATGSTTITVGGTGSLSAVLNASGVTSITIGGNGSLSADAFTSGNTTITVSGSCDLMALGDISGTTIEAGLTPSGIAKAVWEAIAANYTATGTMGSKLNNITGGGGGSIELDLNALTAAILSVVPTPDAIWQHPVRTTTVDVATQVINNIGAVLPINPTTTQIAQAVRRELNTELERIDAAVSTRMVKDTTVKANVVATNNISIVGSGTKLDPWRPA